MSHVICVQEAGAPGNFSVILAGADPSATLAFLNFTGPAPLVPCGSCQVLPLEFTFQTPITAGFAERGLGIPCNPNLQGQSLRFQWIVGLVPPPACLTGIALSFSSVLEVTFDY